MLQFETRGVQRRSLTGSPGATVSGASAKGCVTQSIRADGSNCRCEGVDLPTGCTPTCKSAHGTADLEHADLHPGQFPRAGTDRCGGGTVYRGGSGGKGRSEPPGADGAKISSGSVHQ